MTDLWTGDDQPRKQYSNVYPIGDRFNTSAVEPTVDVAQTLKRGGGDGTSGGMSDDWKNSVNDRLAELRSDYKSLRTMAYSVIAFFALAFAGAYLMLSGGITAVQVEQSKSSARLDAIDKRLDGMDQKLDRIIDKLDKSNK